jgi:hypothetical protein
MAEWLKEKATLNPLHMRDTSGPNEHNYGGPSQDDSSGEYTYGMLDMANCSVDLTSDSIEVLSSDDMGGDANQQRDRFPMPPPYMASATEPRH